MALVVFAASCQSQINESMNKIPDGKNRLALASSPYLRQHDKNPVDWYEWGDEAFEKAKAEDKPVLVSIGYSSCHWCHVMAHESFEDSSVAQIMNDNFVNIKLDREERPDIDQVYMDAVQAMGLNGGWPLNVFVTPDQKPFYGGTYFPKNKWVELLTAIDKAFEENREKLEASADNFTNHISSSEIEKYGLTANETLLSKEDFDSSFEALTKRFDKVWGGIQKAPKFPMPATWQWLLTYHLVADNSEARDHFLFTLDRIAQGGIYDQIGGGFARYSVDGEWHVPHFEKMLYDNGQLLSLYAKGYMLEPKPAYLMVLNETIEWLEREMLDETGGFYAALDADSEGVEGKFYVWDKSEIEELFPDHHEIMSKYYDVRKEGNWEHTNVLRRLHEDETLAEALNITVEELAVIIDQFKKGALAARAKRIRPGLDSKILAGWNGLLLTGLCDTYLATSSADAKRLSASLAVFLKDQMIQDQRLMRTHGLNVEGFLEDYAAVIQGFLRYYQVFFDESYLRLAKDLTDRVMEKFFDDSENLFFYTSNDAEALIARKKEIFDNVIPSSNAIMARNLYELGIIYDDQQYLTTHEQMMSQVRDFIKKDPEFMSYWAALSNQKLKKPIEISIVGPQSAEMARVFLKDLRPNQLVMASNTESNLPLMEYKTTTEGNTTIYVCSEKVCRRPVTEASAAYDEIALLDR